MALQISRYKVTGPSTEEIARLVPGATVLSSAVVPIVDVEADSSLQVDLDDAMRSFGFSLFETAPTAPFAPVGGFLDFTTVDDVQQIAGTFAMPALSALVADTVRVAAIIDDGSAAALWTLTKVSARSDAASITDLFITEGTGGFSPDLATGAMGAAVLDLDAGGLNLQFKVTGLAATTIRWRIFLNPVVLS